MMSSNDEATMTLSNLFQPLFQKPLGPSSSSTGNQPKKKKIAKKNQTQSENLQQNLDHINDDKQ
jgi:hypothetical protein